MKYSHKTLHVSRMGEWNVAHNAGRITDRMRAQIQEEGKRVGLAGETVSVTLVHTWYDGISGRGRKVLAQEEILIESPTAGDDTPETEWTRTAHAARLALLDRAGLSARLAGRAFAGIGEVGQRKIARAMRGEDAAPARTETPRAYVDVQPTHPTVSADFRLMQGAEAGAEGRGLFCWDHVPSGTKSPVWYRTPFAAERAALAWLRAQPVRVAVTDEQAEFPGEAETAARIALVESNRRHTRNLRYKHGLIERLPVGVKLQGPRHTPGLHWPNGEVIANSQFRRIDSRDAHGNPAIRWQWAAFDAAGSLVQVVEYSDLWALREMAAYDIADGSRFVRSHKGH